ncbi:MAG: PIG-L family deacetylase, partial [Ginsengibacter sp.]
GGAPLHTDLMDGVVTDWTRIKGSAPAGEMIRNILANFNIAKPQLSVPGLIKLYQLVKKLPQTVWRNKKLEDIQQIIEECSGLYIEATSSQPQVVQGDNLYINFLLNKRLDVNATLKNISIQEFDSSFSIVLPTDQNITFNKNLAVPGNKKISQPYWLQYPLVGGTFEVRDQTLIGKAENDPSFNSIFLVSIDGEDFTINRPVKYKYIDPVKGELHEPIPVLPKIEVKYDKGNYISLNDEPVSTLVRIKSNKEGISPDEFSVNQQYSDNWSGKNEIVQHAAMALSEKDVRSTFVPQKKMSNTSEEIYASVKNGNQEYDSYTKTISYPHIPTITYFPKASANLLDLDIKIIGKKIGYIPGAGDKVPEALEQMGYEVTTIGEPDIHEEYLKQFDAIITGIRAYNMYEYLTEKNAVLMQYVHDGGNLIVQYLKSNNVGQQNVKVGPFPFVVNSQSRVTEENTPVKFLLPQHPALNYPNKITDEDFKGWIQERSTYQAQQLDPHYEALLSMHDTGEEPSNGSLVIAKYGKGNFVYSGLVFFRQLPAGIPGAFRLMANLIALPENK